MAAENIINRNRRNASNVFSTTTMTAMTNAINGIRQPVAGGFKLVAGLRRNAGV